MAIGHALAFEYQDCSRLSLIKFRLSDPVAFDNWNVDSEFMDLGSELLIKFGFIADAWIYNFFPRRVFTFSGELFKDFFISRRVWKFRSISTASPDQVLLQVEKKNVYYDVKQSSWPLVIE